MFWRKLRARQSQCGRIKAYPFSIEIKRRRRINMPLDFFVHCVFKKSNERCFITKSIDFCESEKNCEKLANGSKTAIPLDLGPQLVE